MCFVLRREQRIQKAGRVIKKYSTQKSICYNNRRMKVRPGLRLKVQAGYGQKDPRKPTQGVGDHGIA